MIRISILCFAITCLSLSATADEKWSEGRLTLADETVFVGDFCLKPGYNVVLFKRGEEIMVFPAYKVASLRVYDSDEKMIRKFVSMEVSLGAQKMFQFYELLVDGPVKVLRRQQVDWYAIELDMIEYDYFIWREGELLDLFKFRRKVYPDLVAQSEGQLKRFVKENRLNVSRMEDILRVVAYYNNEAFQGSDLAKNVSY